MWDDLRQCIPSDTAKQFSASDMVRLHIKQDERIKVLDLGCGSGVSIDLFRAVVPSADWTGVDIDGSPEVLARSRDDGRFMSFDGINIPVPDASLDVVYSRQVMEHVRFPELLFAEIRRILKRGGRFIGSTSHLEPYHSFSYGNFTPWGFKCLIEAAGMKLDEIRAGIDGITLITRAYQGNDPAMNKWFGEDSPLNQEIDAAAKRLGWSVQQTIYRKLSFCGQFAFLVSLPK